MNHGQQKRFKSEYFAGREEWEKWPEQTNTSGSFPQNELWGETEVPNVLENYKET